MAVVLVEEIVRVSVVKQVKDHADLFSKDQHGPITQERIDDVASLVTKEIEMGDFNEDGKLNWPSVKNSIFEWLIS